MPANGFSLSDVTTKLVESIIVSSCGNSLPRTIPSINPLNEFVVLPIRSNGISKVATGLLPKVSTNSLLTYNEVLSFSLVIVKYTHSSSGNW